MNQSKIESFIWGVADLIRDKDGRPEPDPELRDTESVPLADPVEEFFAHEVAG
jgi:type I restriction enzyme M protein